MSDETRDPLEFSELLREGRGRVFGYLLALVQNLADAEDLYQQTALLLWEKFDQYQPGTDFGSWATTVAALHGAEFFATQSPSTKLFSEAALSGWRRCKGESKTEDCTARLEALPIAWPLFPTGERRLVRLRYEGDRSVEDIAQTRTADGRGGVHGPVAHQESR